MSPLPAQARKSRRLKRFWTPEQSRKATTRRSRPASWREVFRPEEVAMCRWLAYSGSPVHLDELLFKPANSLVMQSKHSRLGAETTNGDGFGVGWYGALPTPGIFRSTEPAWNDSNLRELSSQ